jgi:hypothetical protein
MMWWYMQILGPPDLNRHRSNGIVRTCKLVSDLAVAG